MSTRRVHVPLNEDVASVSVDSAVSDPVREDEPCSAPLGEIGGALFLASDSDRYQEAGGALYQPLRPTGSLQSAHITGDVARRQSIRLEQRRQGAAPLWALRKLLSPVVSWLPWLRCVLPGSLSDLRANQSLREERSSPGGAHSGGLVVAMSFHPHLPVVAVAVRDSPSKHRVVLYDVSSEQLLPIALTHAFQDANVASLQWKPHSRDCLAVGCVGGVLLWSLLMWAGDSDHAAPASTSHMCWQWLSDATPGCIFYACTPDVAVSSVVFSSNGMYMACGSEHSISADIHDVSQPPKQSLVFSASCLEGGTSSLCFASRDAYLVRSLHNVCALKVLMLPSFTMETVLTKTPVDDVVRLDIAAPLDAAGDLYALQFRKTEGVAVVRLFTPASTSGRASGGILMMVMTLISTGVQRGIGGDVVRVAASGKRLYLQVSSGHVMLLAVAVTDGAIRSRYIGSLPAVPLGAPVLAVARCFPKGALLAVAHKDEVHFVPSYYGR